MTDQRLKAAIDYVRSEMEKGFYAPDKEYIETLIYYAEDGLRQRLSNTEILMFIRGWQGGTVYQIATELGVTTLDIVNADYDRMQDLMRLAQSKRNDFDNCDCPQLVNAGKEIIDVFMEFKWLHEADQNAKEAVKKYKQALKQFESGE